METDPVSNLDACLNVAIQAAKKAGEIISSSLGIASPEWKDQNAVDLVTTFDRQCEKVIFDHLRQNFPEHHFVGEESAARDGSRVARFSGPTWIVDPIDGTTNFIHGLPMVAVSIALVSNDKPIVGVVYNPVINLLFTASKGTGAFCNGQRMPLYGQRELTCVASIATITSKTESLGDSAGLLKGAILLTEGGHTRIPEIVALRAETTQKLLTQCQVDGIRSYASAAMSMAFLANGCADIYFEHGIHVWDIAAGCLLLEESGGYFFGRSAFDAWSSTGPRIGQLPTDRRGDYWGRKILAIRNPQLADKEEEAGKVTALAERLITDIFDNPEIASD